MAAATFLVDSESRLRSVDTPKGNMAIKPAGAIQSAAVRSVKDPNCGMSIDEVKARSAGNTLTVNGAVYYFCSKRCKDAFQSAHANVPGKPQGE